ncbi:MAG: Hsp70 family protein [Ruminococcus flavefaciens]|nr:Hsp70 family protein [Ruminococcus flavefaciens]MCM1228579.1 Hsp70 family protein [Ruminococcus flavefaciens]
MGIIIGFDFGTCFSSLYFIHGGEYASVAHPDEASMIPTVYFENAKGESFGKRAVRFGKHYPKNLIKYIKRKYKDESVVVGNKSYTPDVIVEKIVRYMINGAKESISKQYLLDADDISVVLTIPVTYGEKWKLMIINALKKLDINISAVIPEPVAAAVYFMESQIPADRNVLVYDLGGGTTDITLLRSSGDSNEPYKVIAQEGEDIGGTDWDERVLNQIEEQIYDQLEQQGKSEEECTKFLKYNRSRLLEVAQEIKEGLTKDETYSTTFEDMGEDYALELTRQKFEECTKGLLDVTFNAVERTLMGQDNPDEIILVGGGSRMNQVMERMKSRFPGYPIRILNPEYAVAMGAAKYATLSRSSVVLKAPHSYGIVCMEKGKRIIHNLVFKNENLPASGKYELHSDSIATHFDIYESDISDSSRTDVQMSEGQYAVSASAWLDRSAGDVKYFSSLEINDSGMLKLTVLDENDNVIAEASMMS